MANALADEAGRAVSGAGAAGARGLRREASTCGPGVPGRRGGQAGFERGASGRGQAAAWAGRGAGREGAGPSAGRARRWQVGPRGVRAWTPGVGRAGRWFRGLSGLGAWAAQRSAERVLARGDW